MLERATALISQPNKLVCGLLGNPSQGKKKIETGAELDILLIEAIAIGKLPVSLMLEFATVVPASVAVTV